MRASKLPGCDDAAAGDRDDPRDQRTPGAEEVGDGRCRAGVVADVADVPGQSARWHLVAGNELDQLPFATGRVLGRHDRQPDAVIASCLQRVVHRDARFGHVGLDGHDRAVRAERLHHDPGPFDHGRGAFPQQHLVAGDPRLALGAVDDQRADRHTGRQLHRGRKQSAAQSDDAAGGDARANLLGRQVQRIAGRWLLE